MTTDPVSSGPEEPTVGGEVPLALPVEESTPVRAEREVQPPGPEPQANGARNGPLVTWRLSSDRTTSLSASVWANSYTNQRGEEYEQLSVTVQRSYLDQHEQWQTQSKPSWRVHDLPCLLFLLQKAYAFALERRTSDSSIPF